MAGTNRDSETVSEKRKRGRPPVMSSDLRSAMACLWPEARTPRSLQNKHYAIRALGVLEDAWEPGFAVFWGMPEAGTLAEMKTAARVSNPAFRWIVLAELGRIDDDARLLEVAQAVCSLPSTTPERNVALAVRRQRVGPNGKADALSLTLELARAFDDYIRRHPDITNQEARTAIDNLMGLVAETMADRDRDRLAAKR